MQKQIFLAGVERVLPDRLIRQSNVISRITSLFINDFSLNLESVKNIYVIGAGKASALMGAEVERILGERITGWAYCCQVWSFMCTEKD